MSGRMHCDEFGGVGSELPEHLQDTLAVPVCTQVRHDRRGIRLWLRRRRVWPTPKTKQRRPGWPNHAGFMPLVVAARGVAVGRKPISALVGALAIVDDEGATAHSGDSSRPANSKEVPGVDSGV